MDHPIYSTTEVPFFGQKKTVLLHIGEGLESLLSICNAMILKRNLVLEGDFDEEWEVLSFLKEKLQELCPDQLKGRIEDAVSTLLETFPQPVGDRIDSFKKNECSEILKVLKIPLYHRWVIEDKDAQPKCQDDVTLSAYGLFCLKEAIENHEVCVLVHNNTFRTATKNEEELYLLNTNEDLINRGMFWEKVTDSVMEGTIVKEAEEEALNARMDGVNAIVENVVYSFNTEFPFFGQKKTVLLHNGEGLESLLSICNAMILKRNLVLEGDFDEEWEVLSFLREKLQELCLDQLKGRIEDAVSTLLETFPQPVWDSIDSFKNNECSEILKVLKIPLYHGWVTEDKDAQPKCQDDVSLSAYGLFCLKEAIENHEICVLVHNNTFRTATKNEGEVYLLVTDKGLNNGGMFWEKLSRSEEREAHSEEGDNNGADGIGEEGAEAFDFEDIEEGAEAFDFEDIVGAEAFDFEDIGGYEEFESDGSMDTQVGGRASPKSVLEVQSSSSADEF